MSLKSAISFLRGVSDATRDFYAFEDGWAYARGRSMVAAHPVPHMRGKFGASASDLDRAVARMGTEPRIEAGDGTLVLRCGRLRSAIDLVDADAPPDVPGGAGTPLPDGLLAAVARVLPFASAEGTWQRSIDLRSGAVRAANPSSLVRVEVPALEMASPAAVTEDVASFLVSREGAVGWLPEPPSAVSFFWPSGAWMRCRLSAVEWPSSLVDPILARADGDAPVAVTDEWREAFADVAALGDGHVDVGPDGIVGRTAHAEHAAEFATGAARRTRWRTASLAEVIKIADAWGPDSDGPAPFRGEGTRGVVAAMRREA